MGEQWSSFESMVAKRVSASSFVVLSGSLPPGAPVDGYARLLAITRAAGVPAAIDAHGEALALALCLHPAVMKINAAEAEGSSVSRSSIRMTLPKHSTRCVNGELLPLRAGVIPLGTEGVVLSLQTDKSGSEPSTPRDRKTLAAAMRSWPAWFSPWEETWPGRMPLPWAWGQQRRTRRSAAREGSAENVPQRSQA